MKISIYGGESSVTSAISCDKDKLIDLWFIDYRNPNISVLQNLRHILEVDFPSRDDHGTEVGCSDHVMLPSGYGEGIIDASVLQELTVECGICYSYRRDVMVPDKACDGPCGKPFHSACLYEVNIFGCLISFNFACACWRCRLPRGGLFLDDEGDILWGIWNRNCNKVSSLISQTIRREFRMQSEVKMPSPPSTHFKYPRACYIWFICQNISK